jgi:hypothetical protein
MPTPLSESGITPKEVSSQWWVYVQHPDHINNKEYAQVHQFRNFSPQDFNDFVPESKYFLNTSKWSKNTGAVETYRVHILRIRGKLVRKICTILKVKFLFFNSVSLSIYFHLRTGTLKDLQESLEKDRPRVPRLISTDSDFVSSDTGESETERRKKLAERKVRGYVLVVI